MVETKVYADAKGSLLFVFHFSGKSESEKNGIILKIISRTLLFSTVVLLPSLFVSHNPVRHVSFLQRSGMDLIFHYTWSSFSCFSIYYSISKIYLE